MNLKFFLILLMTVLACGHLQSADQEQVVVIPPFGFDTHTLYPFGLRRADLESMRYQQVFDRARFAAVQPEGVLINRIAFIGDWEYLGPWSSLQPNFQINLSTTSREQDGLSVIFAENVGADDTVVFGPGSVFWPQEPPAGGGSLLVDLDMPFLFDPAQGNLLLDIRNYEAEVEVTWGFVVEAITATDRVGDGVSRIYAMSVDATAGIADTIGLNTYFYVVPIPEPSSLRLLMSAGAVSGLLFFRRPAFSYSDQPTTGAVECSLWS